ncbi:hypothetical protein A2483_02305 [Candidatus Peregrinibacteria bacterium RIFOXYC2_FULL_33_13]|nr:MAG: hypothetical protein A2483_02305 [Candidatus Peregrinibacteria bacterium RIFOXYC2_FULL_33_13]
MEEKREILCTLKDHQKFHELSEEEVSLFREKLEGNLDFNKLTFCYLLSKLWKIYTSNKISLSNDYAVMLSSLRKSFKKKVDDYRR